MQCTEQTCWLKSELQHLSGDLKEIQQRQNTMYDIFNGARGVVTLIRWLGGIAVAAGALAVFFWKE